MTGRRSWRVLGLALWLAASSCHGGASSNGTGGDNARTTDDAPDGTNADTAAAPDGNGANEAADMDTDADTAKSILRPEVIRAAPAAPAIEPVSRVIGFGTSGVRLDDAGRQAIDALLALPVATAGGPILLRGHTDSRGSDRDNLIASRRRAEAVRRYLLGKGVDAHRIRVIALGETRPVAPNAGPDGGDDPEGRARNRRVEVEVKPPATPAPADDDDQ